MQLSLYHVLFAMGILVLAFLIALPMWYVRSQSPRVRGFVLAGQSAALFALPWLYWSEPVLLRAVVALLCCTLPVKLLDTHLWPGHWVDRKLGTWLAFLLNPFIIVYRLHGEGSADQAAGRRLALRGIAETGLGAGILWWAFSVAEWGPSFWWEHAVKLLGAYLLIFDGGFVLATGLIRMCGVPVLALSREPALAATPADFWRRYNCEAGRFLRADVFVPLGGMRHPVRTIIATFLLNGVLHEYLALIMVGQVTGYQMLFFALHGAATATTFGRRPRGWARVVGVAATVLFLFFSTVLFFATLDLFIPWYSRGVEWSAR